MTVVAVLALIVLIIWVAAWIANAAIIHDSRINGRYRTRRY